MSKIVQAGACLPPAGDLCSVATSAHEAEQSRETVPGWLVTPNARSVIPP
ncbi:hypothetical protein AALM74_27275 [Parabacteroides segnis]